MATKKTSKKKSKKVKGKHKETDADVKEMDGGAKDKEGAPHFAADMIQSEMKYEADSAEMKMCQEACDMYKEMDGEMADEDAAKAGMGFMKVARLMDDKRKDSEESDEDAEDEIEEMDGEDKGEGDDEEKVEESDEEIEEADEDAEDDKIEESNKSVKLAAENAVLREQMATINLEKHIDKCFAESGLERKETKKFKESRKFKNEKQFNSAWKLYIEGRTAAKSTMNESEFNFTGKEETFGQDAGEGDEFDFSSCSK